MISFAAHVGPFTAYPDDFFSIVVSNTEDVSMPKWQNEKLLTIRCDQPPDDATINAAIAEGRVILLFDNDFGLFKSWQRRLREALAG